MADATTLPPDILAQLAAKKLGFSTAADTARGQADQGYSDQLYQLDQMNKDQMRNIDDSFADRGTFNSGIRVDSQGRLARNVGERQGQFGVEHSNTLANIQGMLDQQLQGVNDLQSQYALDYNRTQANQALADAQMTQNTDLQTQFDQLAASQAAQPPAIDPAALMALLNPPPRPPSSYVSGTGGGGGMRGAR